MPIRILVIIALVSCIARAQVSPEEAYRRMRERQAARQNASTQPAPLAALPSSAPAVKIQLKKCLRLKDDAPENVRKWFSRQDEYKTGDILAIKEEISRK